MISIEEAGPLKLLSARRKLNDHSLVTLTFSGEVPNTSATNELLYTIDGGVTVLAARRAVSSSNIVELITTEINEETGTYTVTVGEARDTAGKLLARANASAILTFAPLLP